MGLREARIKAGLSVIKVTEALDVSDAAVYQWETGATFPSSKRLPEIAKLYGVTVDELLQPETEPNNADSVGRTLKGENT